jgi:molecular chaperone HtpG
MSGDKAQDSQLIGQFGVGFYSAFIVADSVTIETRKAGTVADEGVRWESDGTDSYSIENIHKETRGTDITLHLREEEKEFLDAWQLRSIINKFSDHISIPVMMPTESMGDEEEEKEKGEEWEQVNTGTALWMRSKSDISDEEYREFYKHIAHDFEDPLEWIHNRVEGTNEYSSLLYVPKRAPFDLWDPNQKHGVKLYVKRVFIMDEADKLMPRYLRFIKGIVDADDLPLNVSREILQHNRKIDAIRTANIKRVLGLLEKMAKKGGDEYQEFWNTFGRVLKEGPAEDHDNAERIAGLLRFVTTKSEGDTQSVSLDQYLERMPEAQEKIYYITADSLSAARYSPHLEVFRKNDIEVLLLTDHVDEWLVSHLHEYKGKKLQSVAKGELDDALIKDEEKAEEKEEQAKENEAFLERIQSSLGDRSKEVRLSKRLTESPACLVVEDYDMSQNLARVLKQMGQDAPMPTPILEINLDHPVVKKLEQTQSQEQFDDLASVLFDQALLAEGGKLDDPAAFVHRLNSLLSGL